MKKSLRLQITVLLLSLLATVPTWAQGLGPGAFTAPGIAQGPGALEAGRTVLPAEPPATDGGIVYEPSEVSVGSSPSGSNGESMQETTVCSDEPFDGDLSAWTTAFLGNANLGGAEIVGGALELTANGTSLFRGPDNAVFLHQQVSGDFRAEIDITGFPVDEGGQLRKAGMMFRNNLDPLGARVMVNFIPHFPSAPESTALQFELIDENGFADNFGLNVLGLELPVRLAIEKRGNLYTALYSTDGGEVWQRPSGAQAGTVEVDMGDDVLVGVAAASYDADSTVTASFDDFAICTPSPLPPTELPPTVACNPTRPLDLVILLDLSGSMTFQFPGSKDRLQAAQRGLEDLLADVASRGDGSRVALVTFSGFRTAAENLASGAVIQSGFTTDYAAVDALIQGFRSDDLDPGATTPTALALQRTLQLLLDESLPGYRPVIAKVTDGVPNIDIEGRGPDEYDLEDVQEIRLRNLMGEFLSWSAVAWMGDFNPNIGTFVGETLANSMFQIETLKMAFPDLLLYGFALQGNGVDLGTFNEDLLDYGAYFTGGLSYSADGTDSLRLAVEELNEELICSGVGTGVLGDRVWHDQNRDGVQDSNEPGLNGVRVDLLDEDGLLLGFTTTVGDGEYQFGELVAGTYTVRVASATLPTGLDLPTFDLDGLSTLDRATVSLAEGETRLDVDFGYDTPDFGPPSTLCVDDPFDDGALDEWTLAFLGDADTGGAVEVGGQLELTANGTSLFRGADNAAFLYQELDESFRVEVDITGFPVDEGGAVRKAGLMVRQSLDPFAPRVMVNYIPHLPDPETTALQFEYRDETGLAQNFGLTLLGIPLPVRVAIQRIENVYTAFYSLDGGLTWELPGGAFNGSVQIDMGTGPVLAGLDAASYDADTLMTASFDDFSICGPQVVPPTEPPPVIECVPDQALDLTLLVDLSGSMTFPYPGTTSRLDAIKSAVDAVTDEVEARGDGSRVSLVTFSGFRTQIENLVLGARIASDFTTDLDLVDGLVQAVDVDAISGDTTTPTPLAFQKVRQLFDLQHDASKRSVVVFFSDGIPNIDLMGEGVNDEYGLEEVQAIAIKETDGSFRSWAEVAWQGAFNPTLGTFDGETAANTMVTVEDLKLAYTDLLVYSVALQGDGVGLGTFNEELMEYAAFFSGGQFYSAADLGELLDAVASIAGDLSCQGATLGDRVWHDLDEDGLQDLDEPGLNGVTVQLFDDMGSLVGTTVTSGDGEYLFQNVEPGTYTVRVLASTLPADLDVATYDLDGVVTTHQATLTVAEGDVFLEVDFGYKERDLSPPTTVCVFDDFGDGSLDEWTLDFLGDADDGSAAEVAGRLRLAGNGTSLFRGPDNAAFLYQSMDGDFRAEVDVTGFPVDQGGAVRKAGLMIREDLDPLAPRVMVNFIPHLPDPVTTALQFEFRNENGVAENFGLTILDVPLPVRIAIERRGSMFSAFYSLDGGLTWLEPGGALNGRVMIEMADEVLMGLDVASYDADLLLTAEFDDFEVCMPRIEPPTDPPPPVDCDPDQPLDVVLLQDLSGSMTSNFPGSGSRIEATEAALLGLVDELEARGDGTRVALVTFAGFRSVAENLADGVEVMSGLTTDYGAVRAQIESFDVSMIDPESTTPTPLALREVLQLFEAQRDPTHALRTVLVTDGIPNIDIAGRGPDAYDLEEIQAISLRDGGGDFLPYGEVAWLGSFNPEIGTFAGEPLSNSMFEIEQLKLSFPEMLIYGVAVQGDGVSLGTFNEDLLEYAAFFSGAESFSANDTAELLEAFERLGDELRCPAP